MPRSFWQERAEDSKVSVPSLGGPKERQSVCGVSSLVLRYRALDWLKSTARWTHEQLPNAMRRCAITYLKPDSTQMNKAKYTEK
jgi:hypothetical protein